MHIETDRLYITDLTMDMAESVHRNSLDDNNRRFVPDEVFETAEDAAETIAFLIGCCRSGEGPLVYAVTLKDGTQIGHVQAAPLEGEWEIGYHIGEQYTKKGYATEAIRAFLPVIMKKLELHTILGICLAENAASVKVLERSGFKRFFAGTALYQGFSRNVYKYRYTNQ